MQTTSILPLPLLSVSFGTTKKKCNRKDNSNFDSTGYRRAPSSSAQGTVDISASISRNTSSSSLHVDGVSVYLAWVCVNVSQTVMSRGRVEENTTLEGRQTGLEQESAESRLSRMEELQLPNIAAAELDTPTSSACSEWESLRRL